MRLSLILRALDPESAGGGSVEAATEEVVTISRAELDKLRAEAFGASGLDSNLKLDDAKAEWAEALKARDAEYSRAIADNDRKAAAMERAYKAALLDRELATALVGKPLVPGAATQLICLWRDAFEVIDDDGVIQVVSKEGRSVAQAVADRLSGPEFAHFCLPSSRGGTGQRGQNRSATPSPAPSAPRTLGEAVVNQWREAASRNPAGSNSPGWGRRR